MAFHKNYLCIAGSILGLLSIFAVWTKTSFGGGYLVLNLLNIINVSLSSGLLISAILVMIGIGISFITPMGGIVELAGIIAFFFAYLDWSGGNIPSNPGPFLCLFSAIIIILSLKYPMGPGFKGESKIGIKQRVLTFSRLSAGQELEYPSIDEILISQVGLALFGILMLLFFITGAWYSNSLNAGEYATAAGTLILAFATFFLVMEQKQARISQQRPIISAGIEIKSDRPFHMYAFVKNTGYGMATDVNIIPNPHLRNSHSDTEIRADSFFDHNFEFLAPGQEQRMFFDMTHSYLNKGLALPMQYDYHIKFKDLSGRQYSYDLHQDLSKYEGWLFEDHADIDDVVKSLNKIKSSIDSLSGPLEFIIDDAKRKKD